MSEQKEKPVYKMRVNVIHDGKSFNKGEACPEELLKEFLKQGLVEEVEFPKLVQPKPAANPKPQGEKDKK